MRRLLLLMCTVFVSVSMSAESLSRAEALQKALQFMPGKQFEAVNDVSKARRGENDATDAFYIFNAKNKAGFVIVAGDDRAPSILGYADKGEIDMEQMPSNLKYWLESYTDQIRSLKNASPNPVWKTRGVKGNIEPLIKTQWNQYAPYNGQCPQTDSGDRCITGCVATALAQIMYCYQWPEASTAIPAYTTYTLNLSLGELPATTFNWSQMQETYEEDATDDEIAKLFRYVGQAMEMNYNTGVSSAAVNPEAMIKYFNYSKRMQCILRNDLSNNLWESTIYQELAENRPVLYSGQTNKKSGHQFICDGYKDGLFHINWGWGGMSDGYFVLSIANPDEQGAGGSVNNASYSYEQEAYIGFQKPIEGETAFPRVESLIEGITPGIYSRTSSETDFENVNLEGTIIPHYVVRPTAEYQLDCGWALCQDGNILQVVGTKTLSVDDTGLEDVFWYSYYSNTIEASFDAGLADGKYLLCQVYRESETSDWQLCYGSSVSYLVAEIDGLGLTVRNISTSYNINKVTLPDVMIAKNSSTLTINVTNSGENPKGKLYLSAYYNEKQTLIAETEVPFELGQTDDITIQFVPPVSGTYDVTVSTDPDFKNVIKTFEVTVQQPFNRKIVMEEGTATWCGYCVYGIETIKLLQEQYPDNFIAIGLHNDSQMGVAENYQLILDKFTGLPSSILNRAEIRYPDISCSNYIDKNSATATAKIDASASFATADMDAVTVSTLSSFLNSNNAANYKIAYVVVEDHVGPFEQKNYLSGETSIPSDYYMYGWAQSPEVVSMEYNDVARGIYPEVNGLDGSIPAMIEAGKDYSYSYTLDLPTNIQNVDNIRIITLLINAETGEIMNADECEVAPAKPVKVSYEIDKIILPDMFIKNSDAELTFSVTNTGESLRGVLYLSTIYDGKPYVIGTQKIAVEPGKTDNLTIQFVPPISGSYEVSISTDKECQNIIKTFAVEVLDFTRKIVMEEATGTWCGFCVRGIETIKKMSEEYPDNFIGIGLHDDEEMSGAENYGDFIGTNGYGYPGCIFNRNGNWGQVAYSDAKKAVLSNMNSTIAKIEASATFTSSTNTSVKVSTTSTFLNSNDAANYKIAYVVLEDHVGPYQQSNNYSGQTLDPENYMYAWTQKDSYVSMEFNDVARGIYPDFNGLVGSVPTVVESFKGYTYSYTIDLPDNIQNKDNIRIVTLLIDGETGEIVNADECDVEAGSTSDTYRTIEIKTSGKISYTADEALDFSGFEDLKAYVATGFDQSGTIWLTRVKQVPAGTPILIKGTPEESYEVPVMDKCVAYFENMFVGSASEDLNIDATSADGKWNNYYIADGVFKKVTGSRTIKQGKCYLQLPASFNTSKAGKAQKVTISKNGKSSYAPPVDIDLTDVDGLKAYAATGYDAAAQTIWLTRIFKIQAGEGVLLKGEAGKEYTLPSAAVQAYYGNMISGNIGDPITINETSDDGVWTNFYLASGQFKKVSGTREIGTNKSYLHLPTSMLTSSARGKKNAGIDEWLMEELETETMLLGSIGGDNEDGTTRIDAISNDAQPDVYYNLQGQRVDNPKKGLYIKNGKKIVIK